MSRGAFCLVLHGHLPWVLHHGRWPHGEDWIYEAASETWLPLLRVLDQCEVEGIRPAWSVGLTPVLLEQLAAREFAIGFRRYLRDCQGQAERDQGDFHTWGHPHISWLAGRYLEHYEDQRTRFDAIGGDLLGAFRAHAEAGRIELLTSNATHAYHPLLLHDRSARAQIRVGIATSERHLGWRPRGAWLPECAYRPPGPWHPPVVHGDVRDRAGVATLFADEGVRWFVVEDGLVQNAVPAAMLDGDRVVPLGPGTAPDPTRAWGDVLEPVRVVEGGILTELTALGRCNEVAEHVWNAEMGYPGDGRYLEFHKRHGLRGLRYWRVTSRKADLGQKLEYHPEQAHDGVFTHADHFANRIRERLSNHGQATGRYGVLCAPFDAELFGHWWAEGPDFLLEVARRLHHDSEVDVRTVSEALDRAPADKGVALPEGSWGAGGDHRVWLGEHTWFVWNAEYRAEDRFIDLWHRADWENDARIRELLTEAARQLLLLQASDWPFVVSTGGAHDYGTRRFHEHAARFDDLCIGVEDLLADRDPPPMVEATLQYCRVADPVFPDLDLGWWS